MVEELVKVREQTAGLVLAMADTRHDLRDIAATASGNGTLIRALDSKLGDTNAVLGNLADHVETQNHRIDSLETLEAVRAGIDKSNARLIGRAIAIGGLAMAGATILVGVLR